MFSWLRRHRKLVMAAVSSVFALVMLSVIARASVSVCTTPGSQLWKIGKNYSVTASIAKHFSASVLPDDMEARLQRMNTTCAMVKNSGKMMGMFLNQQHKLAYCLMPKAGCTFWKRVFAFLNDDTDLKTPVHSPFDIPRMYIHLYKQAEGQPWKNVKDKIKGHFRFMFSRDPYSRLWSTYLDKFYLPDFWTRFGTRIMKKRKPKVTKAVVECGHNISFVEFIKFSLEADEPHRSAMSSTCDPCVFQPHLLGQMDTFTRDAHAVLQRAGLGWILQDLDHSKHVQNELRMLIEYNFDVLHRKWPQLSRKKYVTDEILGGRLWKTFQYNGYISDSILYQPPSPFTLQSFQHIVLQAFTSSVKEAGLHSLRQQKRTALVTAFQQLSGHTLQRIAAKFDLDFKIFGYSPQYFTDQ